MTTTRSIDQIGNAVRKLRVEQGLSQKALAKKAECSQQAITLLERGKIKKPKFLHGVANALGTTVKGLNSENPSALDEDHLHECLKNGMPLLDRISDPGFDTRGLATYICRLYSNSLGDNRPDWRRLATISFLEASIKHG